MSLAPWAALWLLLPWVTRWDLTTPNLHAAVTATPAWLVAIAFLLAAACWVWRTDQWLGALLVWMIVRSLIAPWPTSFELVWYLTGGGLVLTELRKCVWPEETLRLAISLAALAQMLYVLLQFGGMDPLWWGWGLRDQRLGGTLGNPSYVATYLAMLAPLVMWPVALLILAMLIALANYSGLVIALAALLLQTRGTWTMWGLLVGAIPALWLVQMQKSWLGLPVRWQVWMAGLQDLDGWHWWIGYGPGAWAQRMPERQPWGGIAEYFFQAHNEYVQVLYEGGLIALGCVAGWLWTHRRACLARPAGGAFAAVAMLAVVQFPFHLAIPGFTALLICAWATSHDASQSAGRATLLTPTVSAGLFRQSGILDTRGRDHSLPRGTGVEAR